MARRKRSPFLTTRVPPELVARLDEEAAQLGIPRSELVRILLERAMGDDETNAVVKQALFRIGKPMREAVGKIMQRLAEELPDELLRAIDALEPMTEEQLDAPRRARAQRHDGSGHAALQGVEPLALEEDFDALEDG